MIYRTFQYLCRTSPVLNRTIQKAVYQYLAKLGLEVELPFMNFGYMDSIHRDNTLPLDPEDEPHRSCIQLYHNVVCPVDIEDKRVLEVGCGHGGGASYLTRYMKPRSFVGIDFSPRAIDFCNKWYEIEGLQFMHGDAHQLPFEDESFDAVVNVESSHRYNRMDIFLSEVHRVLRPNGHLLFTDVRIHSEVEELHNFLNNSNLKLIEEERITQKICNALDFDHERKVTLVREHTPRLLHNSLLDLWAAKGSKPYKWFKTGKWEYLRYVLCKEES